MLASSSLRRLRVLPAARDLVVHSRDEVVACGDGVRLLLHHTPPRSGGGGVVVLIHGWEGSASSTYMLACASRLWRAGYRVVRVNLRDHGDSHHLNERLFHSCRLDEVIGAVKWVQDRFTDDRLYLGGYSLGGNFALRIAARAHLTGLQIEQTVAVCPVLDPAQTMDALDTGWPAYRIYFIRKWRRSLELKTAAFPELYDFGDLARFRRIEAMTEHFVRYYTEYPDLRTYLRGYALTGDRLSDLSVPARMLLAEDDPVIPIRGLERIARPPTLHVERSPFGGHCGFLTSYGLRSWLDEYVLRALVNGGGGQSR